MRATIETLPLAEAQAAREVVDSVLVGPTSVEQLDQAFDGLAKPLDRELVKKMDEIQRDFAGTDTVYAR